MGPITMSILGLILLAVLVTVIVKVLERGGLLDAGLGSKILWGTGAVILVVILILLVKLILNNVGVKLP